MAGIGKLVELRRSLREEKVGVATTVGTFVHPAKGSNSSRPPQSHKPRGVSLFGVERHLHPRGDYSNVEVPSPIESPSLVPLSREEANDALSHVPISRGERSSSSRFAGDMA